MSKGHKLRKDKKMCKNCYERPALFVSTIRRHAKGILRIGRRAVIKTDRNHDLCGQCRRSLEASYAHK